MNDNDAAKGRRENHRREDGDRCSELGAQFLASLSNDGAPAEELTRHRAECERCAAEWAELIEFEARVSAHLTDPASLPAEVRAAYVGAQRRAESAHALSSSAADPNSAHPNSADPKSADLRLSDSMARGSRATLPEATPLAGSTPGVSMRGRPPSPPEVSRFAAAILLALTLGLVSSFFGGGDERPVSGELSLIRIERSGEGTLAPLEPFRLRANAVRDGYLTIAVSDGDSIDLLFPHPDPSTADPSTVSGYSPLGAPGFAIGAGEVWEIPNASFGEFTASETPGLETYFLFVRPLSGGLELEGVEESLRENFVGTRANGGSQGSGSETAAERLDRFERWLTARYASVDRVEIRVAD